MLFLSVKNYDNFLVFSLICSVFVLAKTYVLTAMCVADVLPAHIVAGMAGKIEPETEVQLEIIVGSSVMKPDSHLLLV